jgi:GNAT superfamily N-acetyltransferase
MEIRRAGSDRAAAGADLLARAFLHDPGACRLFGGEGRRLKALRSRFASLTTRPDVRVYVAVEQDGTEVAFSVWAAHGPVPRRRMRPTAVIEEIRAVAAYPAAALRMLIAAPALRRLEDRFASPGCHILVALGVEPSLRGKGIGAAMLAHGLDEADSRRAPCYLETTNVTNIDFYRRQGFQVAGSTAPPGSVPTIAMTRAPGSAASRNVLGHIPGQKSES